MKNRLPKYWIVRHENSDLFKNTVVNYLNIISYDRQYNGTINRYNEYYYGYDGNDRYHGTDCNRYVSSFINNPVLITLNEFIFLSKPFTFGR